MPNYPAYRVILRKCSRLDMFVSKCMLLMQRRSLTSMVLP